MNPLGLSAGAKERRRKFITASDAKRIMEGDWPALYREKMGLVEPESLDDKLAVQMGSFTEPFGLWWYEKQTGRRVAYYSDNPINIATWEGLHDGALRPQDEWMASKDYPFMGCSLDARSTTSKGYECVLDQKHVGTFRYDELVERYTAAGTHQAIVCNVDWWCLSVFVGNSRWELIEQECDPFYAADLIAKEEEFYGWLQRGEEPPDMRPQEAPKPQPRLRNLDASAEIGSDAWKKLVGANNWLVPASDAARQFDETLAAFKANGAARNAFKEVVPADIGVITLSVKGGLFTGKQSAAGAWTLAVAKEEKNG